MYYVVFIPDFKSKNSSSFNGSKSKINNYQNIMLVQVINNLYEYKYLNIHL